MKRLVDWFCDLFNLPAFWMSVVAGIFIFWVTSVYFAANEPAKPQLPVLLPDRVEQLSKICTEHGAYGDYLVIEDSRPRQVICKFERKIKMSETNGGSVWSRDTYSYDAVELEKGNIK